MPRAYAAPCLGAQVRPECAVASGSGEVCSAAEGSMCCVLWSGATVSRALRRATWFPVCPGLVPCLGRLKAVFSNKQDNTLDSLPGLAEEAALKLVKLVFAVLAQADLHHQYSG